MRVVGGPPVSSGTVREVNSDKNEDKQSYSNNNPNSRNNNNCATGVPNAHDKEGSVDMLQPFPTDRARLPFPSAFCPIP